MPYALPAVTRLIIAWAICGLVTSLASVAIPAAWNFLRNMCLTRVLLSLAYAKVGFGAFLASACSTAAGPQLKGTMFVIRLNWPGMPSSLPVTLDICHTLNEQVVLSARRTQLRTVSFDFESPDARFKVLINDEEQYSLWPADLEVPGGWAETGVCASKEECDKYLEETWTDMRPKSLRIALDGMGE